MTARYEGGGNPGRDGPAPFTQSQGSPPGRPGGAAGMLRTLSVKPWDDAPIPTAINFYCQQAANLILAGAAGSTVVLTAEGALQAPKQNIVSIQAISAFCLAPSATTSIVYTVRANKGGIPGLTNIKFPPQVSTFINWPVPGPFNVYLPGAYIDVLITRVVADVANEVNFTMLGWYNTPQDALRWTGVQPGIIS